VSNVSGLFITFEGGERAGKSTQLTAVAERVLDAGRTVATSREPGGTELGERLRSALFAGESPGPEAELLVFAAARAQLVHEVIRPALADGTVVLCDRFADSTVAYQQYGRGIDAATIATINDAATGGLTPALTVLLDLSPADAAARGSETDNMEREASEFHDRVRAGYLTLASTEPGRWLVLNATSDVDRLTDAIWERLAPLL
jgi:dTMP kinase